ncbi:Cotranscriptional regulator FAM172A [Balamuthia mandrillaris]
MQKELEEQKKAQLAKKQEESKELKDLSEEEGMAQDRSYWERYLEQEFMDKGKSFLDIKVMGKTLKEVDRTDLMNEKTRKHYDAMLATIPDYATCFEDFNYTYDEEGQLRNAIDGSKFHWVNQAHYDALGDFVVLYIQRRLKEEFGLAEVLLPVDAEEGELRNNIFMSEDALTNPDRLLLLVQGSGAVRPGQWARALCINNSLEHGTIFPYLKEAKKGGYGVIVFNPNQNGEIIEQTAGPDPKSKEAFLAPARKITSASPRKRPKIVKIRGNESPEAHVLYVWDHFVRQAQASDICIVAHSAGGANTMALLRRRQEEVLPKLRAIAFTDSVHWVHPRDSEEIKAFMKENAVNWVRSKQPLDTPEENEDEDDCPCVSAGHEKHEWTSGCAINSVFAFLNKKMGVTSSAGTSSEATSSEGASSTTSE